MELGENSDTKAIIGAIVIVVLVLGFFVVSKMFKSAIRIEPAEMQRMQQDTEFQQALVDARLLCRDKCSEANQDGCDIKAKAVFCLQKLDDLDMNQDYDVNDIDTSILGGIAVCEDGIYCPMYTECKCEEKLDMVACKNIYCDYLQDIGINPDHATEIINEQYILGSCYNQSSNREAFWDVALIGEPIGEWTCVWNESNSTINHTQIW